MTCRPMDRVDQVVLGMAVLVIFAWLGWVVPVVFGNHTSQLGGTLGGSIVRPWYSWPDAVDNTLSLFLVPCLLVLSLVIFGLRLRTPRPRWRRLCRQPGFVACGMVSVGLGLLLVLWLIHQGLARTPWARDRSHDQLFLRFREPWGPEFGLELIVLACGLGLAVMGAWALLCVGEFWRSERSWLDRAGRIVGAGWIGFELIGNLLYYAGLQ